MAVPVLQGAEVTLKVRVVEMRSAIDGSVKKRLVIEPIASLKTADGNEYFVTVGNPPIDVADGGFDSPIVFFIEPANRYPDALSEAFLHSAKSETV